MKPTILFSLAATTVAVVLAGCGHQHDHSHADDGHGHSHNADGSHSDSAQSFSGATHKVDGITLLDETRELLGIESVGVQERMLPRTIRFMARSFDTRNAGTSLASGTVSTNDAAMLQLGLPVLFEPAAGVTIMGAVQRVSQPLATGEAEVVVALTPVSVAAEVSPLHLKEISTNSQSRLTSAATIQGNFGEVTISVPSKKTALVVPREAVINGTTGDLVYVVNGDAYTLTWVELGAEADGWVEVTDGLFEGDRVVTRGVMDLWLVELRAVKGGQGCCPAPPKKGKI